MKDSRQLVKILGLGCAILVLAAPGFGQPIIDAGIDVFQTLGGTGSVISFAADPLPANFLCAGSPAFTGNVSLVGIPLTTNPPGVTANSDTIVERLKKADLSNGFATVPIVVRAMSLQGGEFIVVDCGGVPTRFEVRACTCETQPITSIHITLDDPACGCGRFSGQLDIDVCLTFVNRKTGQVIGPARRPVQLRIDDMSWCERGGPGSLQVGTPFHVDTDCSGSADLAVPCTTNFQPGWVCAPGVSCLDIFGHLTSCHSSFGTAPHEHCVNPVCCPETGGNCR